MSVDKHSSKLCYTEHSGDAERTVGWDERPLWTHTAFCGTPQADSQCIASWKGSEKSCRKKTYHIQLHQAQNPLCTHECRHVSYRSPVDHRAMCFREHRLRRCSSDRLDCSGRGSTVTHIAHAPTKLSLLSKVREEKPGFLCLLLS